MTRRDRHPPASMIAWIVNGAQIRVSSWTEPSRNGVEVDTHEDPLGYIQAVSAPLCDLHSRR